jgi:hypothetical protein
MARQTKRLVQMLDGLTKPQKADYYRVCGLADSKLTRGGYAPLNTNQCELICERLKGGLDITMADIKELAEKQFQPKPRPDDPPPSPDLFDSSDDGSSSSSDPT